MSIRAMNFRNVYQMMDDPIELVSKEQLLQVSGINLENKYKNIINDVCIIEGPTSHIARKSVENFNQYNVISFESFNYKERYKLNRKEKEELKIKEINIPESYTGANWLKQIRLRNHNLSYEEVCRILNHMMVWSYCIEKQEPIIVLEGDVLLTELHKKHMPRNSINCLSDIDFFVHNLNYVCMSNPYAYSIDSFCSKNLFNMIMNDGIIESLDYMIRIDKFNITNSKKAIRIQNNY